MLACGLLPAAIGALAQKGATPAGATGLMSLLGRAHLDTAMLGNIAGLLCGGKADAGFVDYLTKPLVVEQLLQVVARRTRVTDAEVSGP